MATCREAIYSLSLRREVVEARLHVLVVVVDLVLEEASLHREVLQRRLQPHHLVFASLPVLTLVADVLTTRGDER